MITSSPELQADCPCQSGLSFAKCCQSFLDSSSKNTASTAEQLMRSRYCAYTLNDSEYLLKTWHPDFRPNSLNLNTEESFSKQQWISLKIQKTIQGNKNDSTGQVHFIARYKINGKAHKLEENSYFENINGQWLYLKGDLEN